MGKVRKYKRDKRGRFASVASRAGRGLKHLVLPHTRPAVRAASARRGAREAASVRKHLFSDGRKIKALTPNESKLIKRIQRG